MAQSSTLAGGIVGGGGDTLVGTSTTPLQPVYIENIHVYAQTDRQTTEYTYVYKIYAQQH